MKGLKNLSGIMLLAAATSSMAQNGNYEKVGERSADGEIGKDYYSFAYAAPSSTYRNIAWKEFRDKKEKRNTIMVIGLGGYDSYAMSVLYEGRAEAGQGALDIASGKYPSSGFTVTELNLACASTPVDRPITLDGRMIMFMALCVDPSSRAIYQVGISWRSLILGVESLDKVPEESANCAGKRKEDPEFKCPDYIGDYSLAYRKLLGSFSMSGDSS